MTLNSQENKIHSHIHTHSSIARVPLGPNLHMGPREAAIRSLICWKALAILGGRGRDGCWWAGKGQRRRLPHHLEGRVRAASGVRKTMSGALSAARREIRKGWVLKSWVLRASSQGWDCLREELSLLLEQWIPAPDIGVNLKGAQLTRHQGEPVGQSSRNK